MPATRGMIPRIEGLVKKLNPCEFSIYDSFLKDYLCKVRIERNANFRRKGEVGEISNYCQYNLPFLGYESCEDRIEAQTSPKYTDSLKDCCCSD